MKGTQEQIITHARKEKREREKEEQGRDDTIFYKIFSSARSFISSLPPLSPMAFVVGDDLRVERTSGFVSVFWMFLSVSRRLSMSQERKSVFVSVF
jgi:hypothetical protein